MVCAVDLKCSGNGRGRKSSLLDEQGKQNNGEEAALLSAQIICDSKTFCSLAGLVYEYNYSSLSVSVLVTVYLCLQGVQNLNQQKLQS